jgi:hypothetical protein
MNFVRSKYAGMVAVNTISRVDPDHPQYDQFRVGKNNSIGNRTPGENNVRSIQKSMEEYDASPYVPIIVDADDNIIDGQNRYEACRTSTPPKPIYILVIPREEDSSKLMQTLNSGPTYRWKLLDHVNFQIAKNNRIYETFLDCIKTYPEIKPTIMLSVFVGADYRVRGKDVEDFKKGHLEKQMQRNAMNMQKVYHTLSQMYRLRGRPSNPTLDDTAFELQGLQTALLRVLGDDEFDYDDFLRRVRTRPHRLNILRTAHDLTQEMYDLAYRRKNSDKEPA